MEQNSQNRPYITIRIRKHNKKYITRVHNLKIKQKHTKHTSVYTMIQNRTRRIWKECDKPNSHISSKLHLIYISYNNDRHPVTKTFTTLHYTSQHLSTLHFFPFKTSPQPHFSPLHNTCRHFTSFHLKLHPNHTSLHFTTLGDTSLLSI